MFESRAPAFSQLIAWQINSTSDALRREAAMRMKRDHDISLVEWRTLALIEAMQPVRLRDVAAESDSDKAQISRIVSGLVERGLVERQAVAQDARSAHLRLTPSGTELAAKLAALSQDRDRMLRASCDGASMEVMLATLAVIKEKASELNEAGERQQPASNPAANPGSNPVYSSGT
ncbi:MarR family winged helix-turn-helix transcriptional regulator [Caenimonas sp. SL110]|uniref:MarR family winged helix-turn-helix transcriptional regulator n=1 Tax=Caenimonas sp. SL110 TaxID=1450524 RepID=UPI00069FE962|nr:MarR family winged helix-turn-helix transcriptional regulator [Caenimonas sp. SL110]